MSEVLESLIQAEQCCVCGDVADGYHYGVLSCRGCNAFFRRAVTCNMNFTCRRGGNCAVDKNARCACRACRLRKCEEMGMDRRAVQPKHGNGSRHKFTSESSACSTTFTELAKLVDQPSPYDLLLSSPEFSSLGCRDLASYHSPKTSSQTYIAWLAEEYKMQRQKRYMRLCDSLEEILSIDQESILKRPASASDYSVIFKVQISLMFEWVNSLPDFKLIENVVDKVKLLRCFSFRYVLLDNVFHSVELGSREQIVLVNNTYVTPNCIPPFHPDEDTDNRMIKLMMYGESSFRLLEDLIKPMIGMQITEAEMMALRLFIFWNPSGINLSESTNCILQTAGSNAIKELHLWYIDQNFPDADARLSNVLLLLPTLIKHSQDLIEIARMIPSFRTTNDLDPLLNCLLHA